MRERLSRGKRVDNHEWVEGYYVLLGKYHYILTGKLDLIAHYPMFEYFLVDPETVGDYTGLTDRNNKMIFEGDIVRYGDGLYRVVFEQRNGTAYFGIAISEIETWYFANNVSAKQMEVIGNIYDNPELLEVKQNG